jgi:hypothetical protein
LTYDGATLKGYYNGSLGASMGASGNGSGSNPSQISIGAHYNYSGSYFYPFKGHIDEVRMSNAAHSADQIATEYNNQSDAAAFWSFGEEESEL